VSISVESKRFRVFLEGVLVPYCSAISIRSNLDNGISASVDIPADEDFFTRFVPGTRVVAFVDISDEIGEEKEHFALLFDGECQDIAFSESGSGTSQLTYTLVCRSFSAYCQEALFYFLFAAEADTKATVLPFSNFKSGSPPATVSGPLITDSGTDKKYPNNRPTDLMADLFFSKSVGNDKYKKVRPTGFKPDDNGMETLMENLLYFFAYVDVQKGFKQGVMKIFRAIFESHKMRKKVFIVDDEVVQAGLLDKKNGSMFQASEVLRVVDEKFEGVAEKNQPFVDFILSMLAQPAYGGSFADILKIAMHHAHYFLAEHPMPPMVENIGPNNYFLKPNMFFVPPPTCNVIFPCDYDQRTMQRSHSIEPTRGTVHFSPYVSEAVINQTGTINETRPAQVYAKKGGGLIGTKEIVDPSSHQEIEKLKGVKSFILQNTSFAGLISALSVEEAQQDNFYRLNKILLERKLGEAAFRGRSCSLPRMRFSPSLIIGSTCSVIGNGVMCLGVIEQIDHVLSVNSASTNVNISFCRFFNHKDSVDGGGPTNVMGSFGGKYVGGNLKDIYKTFFGSDMLPVGSFSDKMKPDEMSKASSEAMKKLKTDYDKLEEHQRLEWTRRLKKRSYTSEADYFRIMDVAQSNVKNAVVYKSGPVSSFDADNNSAHVFLEERQAVVLDYLANIRENSPLLGGEDGS
jgi:hypothetical protein